MLYTYLTSFKKKMLCMSEVTWFMFLDYEFYTVLNTVVLYFLPFTFHIIVHTAICIFNSHPCESFYHNVYCHLSTFHTSSKHNENILTTNNFKQATVQNYRTRWYEQHLATRGWRWMGHVLRKKNDSISKTALRWTPVGKRKHDDQKTWGRQKITETTKF